MNSSSGLALLVKGVANLAGDSIYAVVTDGTILSFAFGVAVLSGAIYFVLKRLHWI